MRMQKKANKTLERDGGEPLAPAQVQWPPPLSSALCGNKFHAFNVLVDVPSFNIQPCGYRFDWISRLMSPNYFPQLRRG